MENAEHLYREIKNDVFGRENVKKVLGLKEAAASTLIKKMLEKGLITKEEYWRINAKMKAKYHPVSDGLVSEIDLICVQNRA